jgi:hypothetical protein
MRIDRRRFLRAAAGMPTYTATTFGLLSGISGSIALAGLEEKDGELVEAWLDAAKVVGDRTAVGSRQTRNAFARKPVPTFPDQAPVPDSPYWS